MSGRYGDRPVFESSTAGSVTGTELSEHAAIQKTIAAMTDVTSGRRQLPLAAFKLCYAILAAILDLPEISPLHEPAMNILALHVAPGLDIPRSKMLALLYHVLGVIPAYRLLFHHQWDHTPYLSLSE